MEFEEEDEDNINTTGTYNESKYITKSIYEKMPSDTYEGDITISDFDINKSNLSEDELNQVEKFLFSNKDVFSKGLENLGCLKGFSMQIKL